MLAALNSNDFAYRLLYLLHLLAVVVGFGSSFVYPVLGQMLKGRPESAAVSSASLATSNRLTTPMIYAAAFFGVVLVAVSDALEFSDAWISIAFAVFIAMALLAAFVHVPNLKRADALLQAINATPPGSGPPPGVAELEARMKRAAMYGGILHLGFLVLMIDMIWKPGA